jgi:DNA-binding HxlR family transcriptional regulator
MRSYGQFCGLAKALDLVGDRWTLLIIRELLIRGPCRYTDIQRGLPGIATNLLADRLRELESGGLVIREDAPPPIATMVFTLTDRGRALEGPIEQLGLWGAPLLKEQAKDDAFLPHWLVTPLKLLVKDASPADGNIEIELQSGEESITILSARGRTGVRLGSSSEPSAIVKGKPEVLLRMFTRQIDIAEARKRGAQISGSVGAVRRFATGAKSAHMLNASV